MYLTYGFHLDCLNYSLCLLSPACVNLQHFRCFFNRMVELHVAHLEPITLFDFHCALIYSDVPFILISLMCFEPAKIMTGLFGITQGGKKFSINWYPARDHEFCIHHKMNTSSEKTKRKTLKRRQSFKIVVLGMYIWRDFKALTSIGQCAHYSLIAASLLSIATSPPQSFFLLT